MLLVHYIVPNFNVNTLLTVTYIVNRVGSWDASIEDLDGEAFVIVTGTCLQWPEDGEAFWMGIM